MFENAYPSFLASGLIIKTQSKKIYKKNYFNF